MGPSRFFFTAQAELYGATAMVTWFVVVTPPIWICKGTASPVGVPGVGTTPI
jgi:hypothetical protein